MFDIYEKRAAFLISSQHCISYGGIGQFCKGFCQLAEELDMFVDIILDKPMMKTSLTEYLHNRPNVKVIVPNEPISYSRHTSLYAFSEGNNLEKQLNFQNSFLEGSKDSVYDLILINSPDALMPIYSLGLHKYIPVVFYTHLENLIFRSKGVNKVFADQYDDMICHLMELPRLRIGTQTSKNRQVIEKRFGEDGKRVWVLPMPLPENISPNAKNKSGVLFTGRWEKRKNPEIFCDFIMQSGLPAKVLTNARGAKKFKKYFDDMKYEKYEIKYDIIGQEKVDFIESAKVAFHPASLESFGFSAYETLHSCPTFCLEEYDWHMNFPGMVRLTNKKDVVKDILECYNSGEVYELPERLVLSNNAQVGKWRWFLETYSKKEDPKNRSKFRTYKDSQTSPFHISSFFNSLQRDSLAIEDFEMVYKSLGSFNTKNNNFGTTIT